jgi:hypothetical protein
MSVLKNRKNLVPFSINIGLAISLLGFVTSCQSNIVDIELEKGKVSALMDQVHQAHLIKDAVQFYQPNAEQWYDVRNGLVKKIEKTQVIDGTQAYLDSMEFLELERIDDPVTEVSRDGTLASYIGSVLVKGRLHQEPVFWIVSWQSVLKKIDKEWKIISTANTEMPKKGMAGAILDEVRKAIGILPDSTSISARADCKGPIGSFKTLMFSSQKNARMEQLTSSGHIIITNGEEGAWFHDLISQKSEDDLDTLTRLFVQGHEFHWLSLRPQDRFAHPFFTGFTEFDGQTAFKIEFKDALNRSVYLYYAFDNYLPLGMDNPTSSEEERVVVHFSDWKDLENIKVFQKTVIEEGDVDWTYDFTEIHLNKLRDQDFQNRGKVIID